MVIYIDFENVENAGILGIRALRKTDHVYIVYTSKHRKFDVEFVLELQETEAHVEFLSSLSGISNAADFALISHLFANTRKNARCYIISNDHGFDAAIHMGKQMGYNKIERLPSMKALVKLLQKEAVQKEERRRKKERKNAESEEEAKLQEELLRITEENLPFLEMPPEEKTSFRKSEKTVLVSPVLQQNGQSAMEKQPNGNLIKVPNIQLLLEIVMARIQGVTKKEKAILRQCFRETFPQPEEQLLEALVTELGQKLGHWLFAKARPQYAEYVNKRKKLASTQQKEA